MYTLVLHCTQTGKVRVFPQHLFVCRVLLQFNKDLHLSMHVYTLAHTHRDTHRDTDRQTDRVNFLLFRYPFHPGVTAVAGERSRSFCQRCRWQVTATLACTLCMRLCMKSHGAWLYGVHRTRRGGSSFMRHQPCNNQTAPVSTPLGWLFKNVLQKATVIYLESRATRAQ